MAIAEAESIRIKGLAEAEAITAKAKALGNNPLIVKLTEAQNWDGKLPATMLGIVIGSFISGLLGFIVIKGGLDKSAP